MSEVNLPRPPQDVSYVSKLPDKVQGAANNIKKVFDQGAEDIRAYLNDNFVPAVEEAIEDLYNTGGESGENGATFTPSVDANGNLSWTNDKGLVNPEPVNIQGPQGTPGENGKDGTDGKDGATGPQGPRGQAGVDGSKWWTATTVTPEGKYGSFAYADLVGGGANASNRPAVGDMILYNSQVYVVREIGADAALAEYAGVTLSGTGGESGENGATFTPSVDANGNLSWTNDKGLTNPASVNIRGPQGEKGETGAQGPAGKDGAAGPQGPAGEKGDIGPQGPQGPAGETGAQGPQGEKGEKGEKGDTGATGPKGDQGEPGSQGEKGDTGDPGPQGIQGPQGPAGPNEVSTATASSISGMLKGSGGKLAAAVSGMDYLDPNEKGAANGLARLDERSKLFARQASARIVSVTTSKTLALADAGTLQQVTSSSAEKITVPSNASAAFPVETEIEILRYGSGPVYIVAASGVTLRCAETARTIEKQYAVVSLKKLAANEWLLTGSLG